MIGQTDLENSEMTKIYSQIQLNCFPLLPHSNFMLHFQNAFMFSTEFSILYVRYTSPFKKQLLINIVKLDIEKILNYYS